MKIQQKGAFSWRRLALAFATAAAVPAALSVAPAQAAEYPDRTIQIVVPYVAGGSVDAVARMVAQELSQRVSQPVVVVNKAGAGSNIGSKFVADSEPDGYTLLLMSPANAINVSLYESMPYDMRTDMIPITVVGHAPGVLLSNPQFAANDVKKFVEMAKASPGGMNFGSGGSGSSEHLAGEMFKSISGIDLVHVPYKGGAAVLSDLIAGRVEVFFTNQANVVGHIKSGTVKVLGVASDKRSTLVPDVPTFAEQGYPDQRVSVWWGIAAPAGTPDKVVKLLEKEIREICQSAEFAEKFQQMGAESVCSTQAEAQAFVADEIERWKAVVQKSGARVN